MEYFLLKQVPCRLNQTLQFPIENLSAWSFRVCVCGGVSIPKREPQDTALLAPHTDRTETRLQTSLSS